MLLGWFTTPASVMAASKGRDADHIDVDGRDDRVRRLELPLANSRNRFVGQINGRMMVACDFCHGDCHLDSLMAGIPAITG